MAASWRCGSLSRRAVMEMAAEDAWCEELERRELESMGGDFEHPFDDVDDADYDEAKIAAAEWEAEFGQDDRWEGPR
jgi:hypothetical protein